MNRVIKKSVQRRTRKNKFVAFFRTFVAFVLFMKDKLHDDIVFILYNSRLFIGIVLLTFGVFSFSSGKYCDGNSSSYYACTRPSTYYYYEWWTILFIILGLFLIVLWFLRKKK